MRKHTRTTYDQNAPDQGINPDTSKPYRLPTTETTWANDPGTGADLEKIAQTLNDYGPATDNTLWKLGTPGKTITDLNLNGTADIGTDIVETTRYDSEGRVLEDRQPASNGTDAGTLKTAYYTAGATTPAICGGKPAWAGLVCQVAPAAAPTSGPTLPTTTTTGYDYLLAPTSVTETSGTVSRDTTTTYLADGRTASTTTRVTGLTGSTANTDKFTTYDPATGQPTVVTAKNHSGVAVSSITTGHDSWGRKISYQPAGQVATTTVYNAAGDIATITDDNGSTSYTYDGTDAASRSERRGVITKVDVTVAGTTFTSTGAYDPAGSLEIQKLPGGITQTSEFDNVGEPTGLRYTGKVTTLNEDGTTSIDPNAGWLAWSTDNDTAGRVVHEWTPDGAIFANAAMPYDRGYTYDNADRLVQVQDRTAPTGTDPTALDGTPCQTRSYQYDLNSNRPSKTTADVTSGPCVITGGTPQNRTFDTADRPTTHTYDQLGRTTSITAGDSPRAAAGATSLTYYDNDSARRITQGPVTTNYDLDAADRRTTETTTTGSTTATTTQYYNDESDNPSWTQTGTTVRRYAELVGTDLALTIEDGASLTLTNPRGDIVTTVDVPPAGSPAESVTGWNNFDEFGNTTSATASTGPINYGWLGGNQRATTPTGLLLMGARVYNPTTGTFSTVDPVRGGNANPYTYPTNPINRFDLDGRKLKHERGGKSSAKKPTKKQIRKAKAKIRKTKSRYRAALRLYKKAKRTGNITPGCLWKGVYLILLFFVATGVMATVPWTGWGIILILGAWGAIGDAIYDLNDACAPIARGGRD